MNQRHDHHMIYDYLLLLLWCWALLPPMAWCRDPQRIVEDSFHHYRGRASEATVEMVIHRPSWQRSMTLHAWTEGTDQSLIRITAPPKDNGNGTLKKAMPCGLTTPKSTE